MKFRGFSIGIFPKLLVSFLALSIVPLLVLGYFAGKNLAETGRAAMSIARDASDKNLEAARQIGKQAIEDSVRELDMKSTEAIEVRTVDLAARLADFLYERDRDLLSMALMPPDAEKYLDAYRMHTKKVVIHGEVAIHDPDGSNDRRQSAISWENPENKTAWRQRPPYEFQTEIRPLYKEITFVDLSGMEKIKVTNGEVSKDLKDIARIENTYCRAEDYFSYLEKLDAGEIYVSRVIGPYLRGWLYKTEEGIRVKPESGYAGRENPNGKKFEGIVRWATPVYEDGRKTGFLTMALDHAHIMEFTDRVVPTEERFSDISDGGSGNYAFLWDDQDQCISHPRDFFICGYNPETGLEVPGWVSQETYDRCKESGLPLEEFVKNLPRFANFSQKKAGSAEQSKEGRISLDCGILDTAPQCQGWHRGTADGGSGSFLILWSGLWKLTTYAAVPYRTGMYGESPRGFGYVTIGANVDDFHKAANVTKANIEDSISLQESNIKIASAKAAEIIREQTAKNRTVLSLITAVVVFAVLLASVALGLTIIRPIRRLTAGAAAMGRGEYDQNIEVSSNDEIGQLAKSFNRMASTVAEVDRMKSEFVTIASHELRTPIHAMVLGVSGILEGYSGSISDEAREDLQIVNDGIARMTALVESLLDLSRIEARKIEFELVPIQAGSLIDAAVSEASGLVRSLGHTIEKSVEPDIPEICVDRKRILQVLINLLGNSVKYTPSGGRIVIKVERREDEIVFIVADNGYGIPEWASRKVFEKFFQADSIMSQKVGGTGLGLTITKGIVELHGGKIYFESPLDPSLFPSVETGGERQGTVFYVHLPLRKRKTSDN